MPAVRSSQAKVLFLVAILTIVWGSTWVLFPCAVREEVSIWTFHAPHLPSGLRRPGPSGCALARIVVGGFASPGAKAARRGRPDLPGRVGHLASTYAAVLLPSGQAAVLGFTMPIWATVLSWIFLRDRPSARLLVSVALAGCGVGLLAFAARSAFSSAPLGFVVGLSAGLGWAVGTLILKRARLTVPPIVSTGWQLLVAGVPRSPSLPFFPARGSRSFLHGRRCWPSIYHPHHAHGAGQRRLVLDRQHPPGQRIGPVHGDGPDGRRRL